MSVTSAALCLSVVLVTIPVTAQAQSASTVIERYITAIGGKQAIEKIVSTQMSGRVTSADGRSGVFTQQTARPHSHYVSLSWGDSRWRIGFNGRAAWQDDSVNGWRTLYGAAASSVRAEARYASTRLLIPERINRVTVTGREQVHGRPAIVIVAILPDATKRTLFFDAGSHLLVKIAQETDAGVEERLFDDYRRVGQVMEPHRIEWRRDGETLQLAVERVTHNAPLDARLFDVPAPPDPSLDIDAVLAATTRSEQQAESLRTAYAYTMAMTSGQMDPQGRVTGEMGPSFEVFHLGGQPVARQVRKRGGEALSAGERRREDDRVNDLVREYERQRVSGQVGRLDPGGRRRQGQRRPPGSIVVQLPLMLADSVPAYLRVSAVSNIRREQMGSRPVVVVEFQPKSGIVPTGNIETHAGTMAGTLWIDAASHAAIRLDSYMRDDDGGVIEGSALRVERTLVDGEVWLPARIEMNQRWSIGFGTLRQGVSAFDYTDHKKFTVGTDATLTLPAPQP